MTQVAGRLGVASITVRKWCARGLFPRAYMYETPLGALWMIPEVDLKNFQPPRMGRPPKVALRPSISEKRAAGQASAKNGSSTRGRKGGQK